ncbi:DUF6112 family protein [Kribbella deserti]|uniref:DUF6112 family protein n=1 Tax=Kribbella deserti TaxID=1926257 RepID=A0ABV6QS47_9ACTN
MCISTRLVGCSSYVLIQDPGVTPNSNGLPGLSALKQMAGALVTFSLVICVGALVISAAAWALGSFSGNTHYAGKGKIGCLIAGGAAIVIGSANAIIRFASGIQIN